MSSSSTLLTQGLGSWGSPAQVLTLGLFGDTTAVIYNGTVAESIVLAVSQSSVSTRTGTVAETVVLVDGQTSAVVGPVVYSGTVAESVKLTDSQSSTGGIVGGNDSFWSGLRYSPDGALYVTYTKTVDDFWVAGQRVSPLGQLVLNNLAPDPNSVFNAGHMFTNSDSTLTALVDVAPSITVQMINGILEDELGGYLTTVFPG